MQQAFSSSSQQQQQAAADISHLAAVHGPHRKRLQRPLPLSLCAALDCILAAELQLLHFS
jgi:hypothetical protein